MTQLWIEIRNLIDEIEEIKAVKDKELKRQKEEFLSNKRIIEQEKEEQQKENITTMQGLIQSIRKLQKEMKLAETGDYDR